MHIGCLTLPLPELAWAPLGPDVPIHHKPVEDAWKTFQNHHKLVEDAQKTRGRRVEDVQKCPRWVEDAENPRGKKKKILIHFSFS